MRDWEPSLTVVHIQFPSSPAGWRGIKIPIVIEHRDRRLEGRFRCLPIASVSVPAIVWKSRLWPDQGLPTRIGGAGSASHIRIGLI